MNDMIKELAKQVNVVGDPWRNKDEPEYLWFNFREDHLKKFVELIVQECITITDELVNRNTDGSWTSNELYTDYNGALCTVKRRIQDTFGVEE